MNFSLKPPKIIRTTVIDRDRTLVNTAPDVQ